METPAKYKPFTALPVRVEVAVFRAVVPRRLEVALLRREYEPFRGAFTLPGSFLRPEEGLGAAARRVLATEIKVREDAPIEQVRTDARPGRDPRGPVVSVVHAALLQETSPEVLPGIEWNDATAPPPMAFDHRTLLEGAVAWLREKAVSTPLVFSVLPDAFALRDLQELLEAVLDEPLDRRNFRRKLKDAGFLAPARGQRRVGRHRPAQLYRFKPDAFARFAGRFRGRDFLR